MGFVVRLKLKSSSRDSNEGRITSKVLRSPFGGLKFSDYGDPQNIGWPLQYLVCNSGNKHNCEKVFSEKVYHVLGDLIFSSNKRVKEFLLTLIMKGC